MRYLLYFLKEAKQISSKIILPSKKLVDELRNIHIPRLVAIVEKEA